MAVAWTTVRGGQQHKRALQLQQQEEEATMVVWSKRINLGHNVNSSRVVVDVEHIEAAASTTTTTKTTVVHGEGRQKKRTLAELHKWEEDSDEYCYQGSKEATFMAGADGAYTNSEMPKRMNLGYDVGESSARMRALYADDERDAAMILRLISAVNKANHAAGCS